MTQFEATSARDMDGDNGNGDDHSKNASTAAAADRTSKISKRPPTVSVDDSLYAEIKKDAAEKNMHVLDYVNSLLQTMLDKKEFRNVYFPTLHFIGMYQRHMYIKDDKKDRVAEVSINCEGKMICCMCDQPNCEHVIYAMAMPESVYLSRDRIELRKSRDDTTTTQSFCSRRLFDLVSLAIGFSLLLIQ